MTPSVRDQPERPSAIRTFLIADIRGYTRFTNELGDEAGSRLAAKFAQVTMEAVEAYGGTLLELRGDEALCVFNSARAALRCAVELQDAYLDESRVEPNLPLRVGIGLDAGEAVPVGEGYRGAALNLAARLCSAADAGTVIATDGLVHLAGRLDDVGYEALNGRPLKGFDQPIAAWRVTAAASHEHGDGDHLQRRDAEALPAELDAIVPLVGRESDLRWLGWFWRRARHGHGGAVVLSGPVGIGRTRLCAEIAALAHAQGAAVRYHRDQLDLEAPPGWSLLVLDDVHLMPIATPRTLLDRSLNERAHGLVVITHGEPASSSIESQIRSLVAPERRRLLGSLDVNAVAEIARLYLERPVDDVPAQLLHDESEGLPAAVHRVASQWARHAATRRLGQSARRTSRERRELRAAEADLIGDVKTLETVRERSRLYIDLADVGGDRADAEPDVVVCPYKGLAPFEAADDDYYFGRERLIAELIARMVGSAFVGLIGASGSGKSSALQAGLLPALAGGVIPGSDQWIQLLTRPGEHPLRELQAVLHRALPLHPALEDAPDVSLRDALRNMAPAQRILLVVDQFEELFTGAADESERAGFIRLITEQMPGLKVLVALRADYYERCAAYPRLARRLGAEQVLVGPPAAEELAAIVKHPAERVGLRVEPELVDALVADIGTEPGGLPLLSTALLELWEARDAGRLSLASYRATDGVHGAVARLAERAYGGIDSSLAPTVRAIFLRLAGEGDAGTIVRRRVRRSELDADANPEVTDVLDHFTAARLLTASNGYVEVAHEALLREWPRLRGWLEEDAAGRQLRLHLMQAARTWDEGRREPGDLYRGARLTSVLDWSLDHLVELNATERAFVDESRRASEREADHQRRANRNLRGLLAGAVAFLVLAVGAGFLAIVQSTRAEARELAAAAISVLDEDPELSILLALEAAEVGGEPAPEAVTALHRAVQASRSLLTVPVTYDGDIRPIAVGLAISPDGRRLYVQAASRSVRIHDAETGELLNTLGEVGQDSTGHHLGVALSNDGQLVAAVDEDGMLRIWTLDEDQSNAVSVQEIPTAGFGTARRPALSADGRRVATVTFATEERLGHELILQVWDVASEDELQRWEFDRPVEVRFDPDSSRLLVPDCSCDAEGPVEWFDIESGETEELFRGAFTSAVISPDGSLIGTGGGDRVGNIWDAQTGEHIHRLQGHRDVLGDVAFSPDGARFATTGQDGAVRIWDVATGDLELILAGQLGTPWTVSWTADGTRLVTGSAQSDVKVWDVTVERAGEIAGHDFGWARIMNLERRGELIAALGRSCLVGVCAGDGVVFDLSGRPVIELEQLGSVGIGLESDARGLWTQPINADDSLGRVGRYRPDSSDPEVSLDATCERSFSDPGCGSPPVEPWNEQARRFALSPDEALVAVLGNSGALSLWEAETGALVVAIPGRWLGPNVFFSGFGITFSPDGKLLAISGRDQLFILELEGLLALDQRSLAELDAQWQETVSASGAVDPASPLPIATEIYEMMPVVATLPLGETWRIEFTADGSKLAAASPLGNTRVFDTEPWEQVYEMRSSWDLDISPDGSRLATFDNDGVVRLWDLDGGELTQTIPVVNRGLGALEGSIRFASNGRHLLVSDGGSIFVHTTDVDELIKVAESRLTRSLTEEECERFLRESCVAAEAPSPGE